ncbi:hypothetical protein [Tenacibaculum sp. IB213877]|uniref:hypothetical protein n=1 Tax=Tenacibaculum sp. IB213877 TaxID=3097351 RepID=UPI002A598D34|nr:hypothetical protein [Tenacibaculum sp. IB213877]MDY0780261.1 hypothetical protein [Tenacibaculum sp. IB213877]
MSLVDKFQQKVFWANVFRVALPFFIIVTIFSFLFTAWDEVTSGNFEAINQKLFSEGKWMRFWLSKIVISLGYGMYVTNKNMK